MKNLILVQIGNSYYQQKTAKNWHLTLAWFSKP